ncbi:RNA polymerase sigma24 factor [Asanoa ishikariensis]|uniref:RNA polymerase sigma-70 factor, sigma-E family n=1 Tax=Asanoa ishikariensis TaxID=137265 RepID=A0A1H3MR55_9ACTN|nr:SigE family RNA polymerase sigma factor [Asanoa ishikariensis]GIF66292.1 RNA polymerase sigma24 factor [Asanoa ishikariensis]SDY79137.1 RNA polymerase sigma-70 factor, sigma-E family [Asanoa ishikariensis]
MIGPWGAARRREQEAEFTAFVEAAAPRLRRTAYLMCRDWHLAQDLTQTTFVSMYEVWGRIRHTANLEAYSRRVLMNAVFDQRKRRSAGEVVLADLPEAALERPADTAETHVVLLRALATLPVRDQAIVVLRHWEDLSVETVAGILDVSVSVVKTQNGRALGRLRAALGEDFART